MALTNYITQVRRLLHDPNGQYFSDSELTDYINEARNRVCKDTRCLRVYIPSLYTLTLGVEQYTLATLQASSGFTTSYAGYTIIDVMGVTVIWGSTRVKLAYMSWSRFDAQMRYWTNMQSRPVAFTRMGSLSIYVGPQPDTSYVADFDLALIPPVLTSDSTPEPIPEPFTTPIKYYAAYLAKFRLQDLSACKMFKEMYTAQAKTECVSFMQRVIPDPYAK